MVQMIKIGRLTWNEQYIPRDEEGGETCTMDNTNDLNNLSNYGNVRQVSY